MEDLISIITTTYNADQFIGSTISSILAQDYTNFEHIIVDDGSSDHTIQKIRSINDPRIRCIEAGRVGRGKALNIAFHESRGDFIAIQDADDLSHPDRLRIEVKCLKKNEYISLLGTGEIIISSDENVVWKEAHLQNGMIDNVDDVSKYLVYYNPISHTSVIMRRKALEAVGGYNESRKNLFDWDLYIRLAASGHRIARLPVPLIAKRRHPNQFFESKRRLNYVYSSLRLQIQAIFLLGKSMLSVLSLPVLFVYRLLPGNIRMAARRRLKLTLNSPPHQLKHEIMASRTPKNCTG